LNRAGTLHRIGKRASTLLQELGRQPTNLEISEGMDISEDEVAKTMMISQVHLSLDAPMTPGVFLYHSGRRQVLPKLRAFIDHVRGHPVDVANLSSRSDSTAPGQFD